MDLEPEGLGRPALHDAAIFGDPATVAQLVRRNADVDAVWWGRTALWQAVMAGQAANARVLFEAGADPWRPMMAGWSPGRLALAGPTPDLFHAAPAGFALSDGERAAITDGQRLIEAMGDFDPYASSFGCVAGIGYRPSRGRSGVREFAGRLPSCERRQWPRRRLRG